MTQGKVTVSNKSAENGGGNGNNTVNPPAPPSYEEATSEDGKKANYLQTSPSNIYPGWTQEDAGNSPGYNSAAYSGDTEMLTSQSWEDDRVRSIVFLTTYLVLACCSGPRRYFPWNLILLCIFTLSMSYVTGMLSSYYNTTSVILCLGITALVCISVTLFSFQTKVDFTSCHGLLFVLVMVLFFSGLFLVILIPFQYVPWLHAVYAALGAIVFTLFLAFDTQILMGSRRFTLSPEEYIFGALNIYLDIIYIFSFFLQLFGTTQD